MFSIEIECDRDEHFLIVAIPFNLDREHPVPGYYVVVTVKLQGIFPPVTTPFDHSGNIYAAKVQHNIEKWNRTGLAGYAVLGSTGESVMLTAEEKISMWEM